MIKETHAVRRTNATGQPFIGTCIKCGKVGLSMKQSQEYCENVSGITDQEALLSFVHEPKKEGVSHD